MDHVMHPALALLHSQAPPLIFGHQVGGRHQLGQVLRKHHMPAGDKATFTETRADLSTLLIHLSAINVYGTLLWEVRRSTSGLKVTNELEENKCKLETPAVTEAPGRQQTAKSSRRGAQSACANKEATEGKKRHEGK